MNSFLMWLGGLLVAVLAALFVVPHFIDWNGYRGVFETQASRILGRDVRVGGEVNVRFLPTPYVRFERVRIAEGNETGFGGRSFFRADSFTMWLTVPPLLKGVLEAHDVEIQRPSLRLALDEAGRGNWRTFKVQSGTLPFVPAGVSLQSVNITDGTLTFDAAGSKDSVRIEAVNGRLSAASLDGPYKFDGSVSWQGGVRDIKFATFETPRSEPEAVPARLQVTPKETGNSYVVEGKFRDLTDIPQFVGKLKADIALTNPKLGKAARPHIELSGTVTGTGTETRVTNLIASFEDVGQPQLINGDARVAYGEKRELEVTLISRWLDLDKLIGLASKEELEGSPIGLTGVVISAIAQMFPEKFETNAQLSVEQVQLGGDTASGIRVGLTQDQAGLKLRNLSASLPGGAQLKLSGAFERTAATPSASSKSGDNDKIQAKFIGDVFVGGPSSVHTIQWATQRPDDGKDFDDGAFIVAGDLAISSAEVALTKVNAEYAGRPIEGGVIWQDGSERTLNVMLEGHEIDARWFGLDEVTLATFQSWLSPGHSLKTAAVDGASSGAASGDSIESDASANTATSEKEQTGNSLERIADRAAFRVKAGRFNNGPNILRDVDAEVRFSKSGLQIDTLKFHTSAGLEMTVDGALSSVDEFAKGQLNWQLAVSGASSVAQLSALLDLDVKDAGAGRLIRTVEQLSPLDMAGSFDVGRRRTGALDILADGVSRGGHAIVTAQLDAGAALWRTAPLDVTFEVENSRLTNVLGRLTGSKDFNNLNGPLRPGRATIKVVGIASEKLLTAAQVTAEGLTASFSGHLSVGENDIETAEGQLDIATSDIREALHIAGIRMATGATGVPASGKITMALDEGAWVYWPEAFAVAGQKVSGSLAVVRGSAEKNGFSVAGKLQVAAANFESVLSPLLEVRTVQAGTGNQGDDSVGTPTPPVVVSRRQTKKNQTRKERAQRAALEEAAAAQALAQIQRPKFSDQVFDFATVGAVTGDLEVRFGSLTLASGLTLNDANLQLVFQPGKVILKNLTGSAAGGQLAAKGTLEAARAGVTFNGDLIIENANLADLVPAYEVTPVTGAEPGATENVAATDVTTSPVAGSMILTASASGQALTLRGLISSLQGTGEAKIDEVVIKRLHPGAVTSTANAVLVEGEAVERDELLQALKVQLGKGETVIPATNIPLKIVDGTMRFAAFVASGRVGALRNMTTVDLTSLSIDSAWEIKSRKPTANGSGSKTKTAWPDVRVGFVGSLANLGQFTPTISTSELERELAVRRIQRNVDELERLRREDEERATAERERRKQRKLERARAAEREDQDTDSVPPAQDAPPESAPQAGAKPIEQAPPVVTSDIVKEDLPAVDEQKIKRRVRKRKNNRRRKSWSTDTTRFNQQAPYPY